MSSLQGKNILLTRSHEQNRDTACLVYKAGGQPIFFPCLSIEYLAQHIQRALKLLASAPKARTDIIFSSSNGVAALAALLPDLAGHLAEFRLVAVGKKTAQALEQHQLSADIIPLEASQKGLIEAYKIEQPPQQAFFFRAEHGSDDLSMALAGMHVDVTLVPAYRSVCNTEENLSVIQQLQHNTVDAVLLGSAKTAQFYTQKINNLSLANRPAVTVISPQVAEAADKLGLEVQVIAKQPSFAAMLDGLMHYFSNIV